jgi:glucose/arabinose dehydrogenase
MLPRGHLYSLAILFAQLLLWPGPLAAQTVPSGFQDRLVGDYWPEVAGFTFDEAGRMYVWERGGKVWTLDNDVKHPVPLVDIAGEVGAWRDHGMLGFALDPNFRQNGYIYLLYVVDHHHLAQFGTPAYNPNTNEFNRATIGRLTRYTARASDDFRTVDPASRQVLFGETASTGCPILFYSHGVGSLVFGMDGTLLASCGDGAALGDSGSFPGSYHVAALAEGIIRKQENVGAFRSQMVDSMSGKILRVDPRTGDGVPSNPFYDPVAPRSARSRVWALGLRNPFRVTLQPGTGSHNPADANPGTLYIGDVGYDER